LARAPSELRARARSPISRAPRLPAPTTLEETGLPFDLMMQLTLKLLATTGEASGHDMAERLGLPFATIAPTVDFLKAQRHCEIVGGGVVSEATYRYRITTEGRSVAAGFLGQNRYVGAAPVPLRQYHDFLSTHAREFQGRVTRDSIRSAFEHLVLSDAVLDELGPAVNGGHSIFIYGPPGNGKSVMAEGIRALLPGDIAIPHAIEVEGQIIRVFDPVSHERLDEPPMSDDDSVELSNREDRRWVRCRRPVVKAGGELRLESLDLTYDPRLGFYQAPLQLLANGGVLILDDFGRQRCSPHDLLNRWMIPLETRVDYLTLQTGLKFSVPFLALVVFATNLDPASLVDEAFLRRVHYKVYAQSPTRENFVRIFGRCCAERNVPFDQMLPERLLTDFYEARGQTPRACDPRDLITHALLLAEYSGAPRELTIELLNAACASYFVQSKTA
jgi:predicted ATPase with chaperone activity